MTLARIIAADGSDITFSQLTIRRSVEELAGRLSFASFEYRAGQLNRPATVQLDSVVRWTGFLEQLHGTVVDGFQYEGRSLTSSLLLVDAAGNELFRQSSVSAIARALATRAGVAVASVPADKVQRFRAEKARNLGEQLQRLAEVQRLTFTDDAQGRLVGYRAPDKATATWTDGAGTVTAAFSINLNFSSWVNTWTCRGQRDVMSGELDSDDAGQIGIDIETSSLRPGLRVLPNNQTVSRADAKNFVDWNAKKALASTVGVTVKHGTWAADPGTRVRLRSSKLGLDEDFVVSSVTATVSEGEVSYTAECVLPDVYTFRPLRPRVEARVSDWEIAKGPVEVVR
jgi:prophage tail gpP-like protein